MVNGRPEEGEKLGEVVNSAMWQFSFEPKEYSINHCTAHARTEHSYSREAETEITLLTARSCRSLSRRRRAGSSA